MRRRWGRFRGYMDEVEEDMRMAGARLEEAEALAAVEFEKSTWRQRMRERVDVEIVRRALDIPFLGDLVRRAWRVGPDLSMAAPDFEGTSWADGESVQRRPNDPGFSQRQVARAPTPMRSDPPPARLRSAERALGHRTRSLVVCMDDLVSPRNASAVIRTADALGLQEVHLIQPDGQQRMERTVTMRAERWLDVVWYRDGQSFVDAMRERGLRILVSDFAPGAVPVDEAPLCDGVALVFGSEQRGVSDVVSRAADGHFYLPTLGFTSYLNVSVAAGMALWAVDRRMREEGLRKSLEAEDRAHLREAWYGALARGNVGRAAEYQSWLDDPPDPAPDGKSVV